MIIISDTTPIISLLKIKHLDLLQKLFGEIWIPNAVYEELISNKKFSNEARQIMEVEYIEKVQVGDSKSVRLLQRATGLDAGESEAIILSDEKKADILLMDEAKGRLVAKQMGLTIMGTVGILMTAYEEQLLTSLEIEQCIEALRENGRHISEKLYQQLRDKFRE
ncbi:MAG: DUF3368 domain-containing protein [Lachnospiraceae bacterium]|nr:DUF3368 domain-containing protein [Lachnospiraceae bacterium]MCD7841689.1 DUF3368 domain-containing protein [Lachnospiraceae bacterium]